jgi:hypothetical protein
MAPMRPMDAVKVWFLDYVSPQSTNSTTKPLDTYQERNLMGTFYIHDCSSLLTAPMSCAWTNILAIIGRMLTEYYAELSLNEVKAHAQEYQDEGERRVLNAEMLLQCLKASISETAYSRFINSGITTASLESH